MCLLSLHSKTPYRLNLRLHLLIVLLKLANEHFGFFIELPFFWAHAVLLEQVVIRMLALHFKLFNLILDLDVDQILKNVLTLSQKLVFI